MKKIQFLLGVAAVLLVMGVTPANAQGRYGKDSAKCVSYLNFYRDYLKQGNYKEAAALWRGAFKTCPPKASHNMFIDGRKIMQKLIRQNANNPQVQQGLIDTLMLIHEIREATYPKYKGAVAENRAYDMLSYYGETKPEKVLDAVESVVKIKGQKTKPALLVAYMSKAAELYKANKIEDAQVLKAYTEFSPILEAQVAANPNEDTKGAYQVFENAFVTSGVANCENLKMVFTPRFEADPTNLDVIKPIVKLFAADSICVQSELFLKAVTAMHQLEPSYNSSYYLYKLHASKKNPEEAVKFLEEAIASPESDDIKDADLLLELAVYSFKQVNGGQSKAVSYAKQAIEKNGALAGKAYVLMATIWANQKCHANDMDNRAKYWVAVDYLQRAKSADETLTEEANSLISQYRQYFPKTEDAFMYDLIDGKSYSISCGGMSATTTVRTLK